MELLNQRFQYFKIDLIKDSQSINRVIPTTMDLGVIDGLMNMSREININKTAVVRLEKHKSKGKKTKYFYTDEHDDFIAFEKILKSPFETTKERHLKRHYGNPFASVSVNTFERTIKLKDNKLYLRYYQHIKFRNFNCKYFNKTSRASTFTIDLTKGDFTIGIIDNGRKIKYKKFRKNSFSFFETLVNSNPLFAMKNSVNSSSKIYDDFIKIFDNFEFLNIVSNYIKNIPNSMDNIFNKNKFTEEFINFFVEKKRIKTPNEFTNLIKNYYPTEKYLKKNERKLGQSILDYYGIKSKLTNKILHENKNLDISSFCIFCSFFGDDHTKYIGALKKEVIEHFFNDSNQINLKIYSQNPKFLNRFNDTIENFEKENIIKIVNSLVNNTDPMMSERIQQINGINTLFFDHFNMLKKIRKYIPDIKMKSTTYLEFHNEHLELTKMCKLINKGWSIEYQYDNRMTRLVEEEINTIFNNQEYIFKPIILKRDEEYGEEGTYMHHCVASYSDKETSMIISIRTLNNFDRITCEFSKKTGDCLQARYFCNKIPPNHFDEPLQKLKERVKKFANQRLLDHIDVKKVKLKINGKDVIDEYENMVF